MKSTFVSLSLLLSALAPAHAADPCRLGDACDDAPACAVIQSVADLDVPQVRLGGDFFVNGAPPFWFPAHTGTVELVSPTLGRVTLGQLHEGGYDVMVIPGVYDVVYRHDAGVLVPRNSKAVLMTGVEILDDGFLDVSVPAVIVGGDITLNGAPPPASVYERGQVALRDPTTGAITPLGWSHLDGGSYTAVVVPGAYDVVYRYDDGNLLPRNSLAILSEDVMVTGGALDIDIPTVTRTGAFKIGGALAPQSVYENGLIFLRDASGNVTELGETRDRTYAVKLVPGTYDAVYSRLLGDTIVPLNTWATVLEGASMNTAGARDIDVPVVAIAGDLRIDGQPFPASAYNRARIWLEGAEPWDVFPIGTSNDQAYAARVVPGTYDVRYQKLITTGLVPANPWAVIEEGRPILPARGVRRVDIAVTSGWLDVEVTVWGDAPPASVYEHAAIHARPVGGGARLELFRTHHLPEPVRVLAGDYAVSHDHKLAEDVMAFNDDALLGEATAQLVLPPLVVFDLHPGPLSGVFTHDDLPFPADAGVRADFGLRDVVTGDVIDVGPSHAGGYNVMLLEGTYEIVYDYVQGSAIPANRDATLGCITFAPIAP